MKNIYKALILLFGILVLNSCTDELDQQPHDGFSPETYYQSVADFENATKGIYEAFVEGGSYYSSRLLSRPDIMADNVIMAQSGRHSNQSFNEWRYSPNLYWDMMYAPYLVINRANIILDNIDRISDGTDKDNFIGEAKAARALALFDMLRLYSKIPTQSSDANTSLGVPVITGTDPAIQKLRPTVSESYASVISDLEAAKSLINNNNGAGRLNKNAVNAILSRVYLYTGNYANVITSANNLVDANVASISDFAGVWTDSNEAGVLFKIDQDQSVDNVNPGVEWSQSVGGTIVPEYVVAFDFFNLYSDTDVRKDAYTFLGADSSGNNYNAIKKMYGEVGQNNGQVDPKVIRVAEVLLNKAEAYAHLGDDVMALETLDELRANRYSDFVIGTETGATLLEAIKLERRLELFAEGHRFFDLKRWNQSVIRSATNGDFSDGTGTPVPADYTTLPAGNFKFQLPIMQREINIFPEFQQNPGY